MCGITGFFIKKGIENKDRQKLNDMMKSIDHRGPDDSGFYETKDQRLMLAHTRLSILDLSPCGNQPMLSESGQYVIAFNGEIYNYLELRAELEKNKHCSWHGHSDTEVLLGLFDQYGVVESLNKLNGMFAFCVYDVKREEVTFARDRFGEKPLYIWSRDDGFAFASELKCFEKYDQSNLKLDTSAVDTFLRYSYVPSPGSIYKNIYKLGPGQYFQKSIKNITNFDANDFKHYWSASEVVAKSIVNQDNDSIENISDRVDRLLKESIRKRMLSDVSVGAFLSGGIDSTAIVCVMQELSRDPIKTFSIGFEDKNYNEACYAKDTAKSLGTDHHELIIDPKDAMNVIPSLPDMFDEPFADSSQIPTHIVSKFARNKVTVALSGDSGDEIFCGYVRYNWLPKIIKHFDYFPLAVRKVIRQFLMMPSPSGYDRLLGAVAKVMPALNKHTRLGEKIHKFAGLLDYQDERDLYRNVQMSWRQAPLLTTQTRLDVASDFDAISQLSYAEKMMLSDTMGYMQNDILAKVDRASMFNSLETRVPYLDHELFEYMWRVPMAAKLYGNQSKYLLRRVIGKRISPQLIDRPKTGFGLPIDQWLRFGLRDWAEDLLSENKLNQQSFLDTKVIRNIWKKHLNGDRNFQHLLWSVLMFQAWSYR